MATHQILTLHRLNTGAMRRLTHSYPARFLVVAGAIVAALLILELRFLVHPRPGKRQEVTP